MAPRSLIWVVLLGAALHIAGMARTYLPAQDGLKFIEVARQFQTKPWAGVVRGTDRHPLYSALIAITQPLVALGTGPGHVSWRVAAQAVSALASLALLVPLYGLSRTLFDERTAWLAALIYVLLPLPAEVGYDTLSDSLALFCALTALQFGEIALRSDRLWPALGCGLAAGCGYLTRPEVLVVPLAIVIAARIPFRREMAQPAKSWRFPALAVCFLAIVGTYALVKGEVSEKLAVRRIAAIPSRHDVAHKAKPAL